MKKKYDIIIVGGGLIGASLALALTGQNLDIALLEPKPINEKNPIDDTKSIVLSHGSRMILESIGVWPLLKQIVCPVKKIHVSDQGNFGITRITAEEEKVPALGYVISSKNMIIHLYNVLKSIADIDMIEGEFVSLKRNHEQSLVTLKVQNDLYEVATQLIVAADGQKSPVRQQLNIDTQNHDYQQVAVTCQVKLQQRHDNTAFERFTQEGPLALLPMSENSYSVIWTVNKHNKTKLCELTDDLFIQRLQKSFGYRLGRLSQPSSRMAFPLQLSFAKEQAGPGAVLIGNAAHTLHPIAGQGLNLGLRDMAVLAEEISLARKNNLNIGSATMLANYYQRRKSDQQAIIAITHNLVGVFSNAIFPMILMRSSGLVLIDMFPAFKKILTRRTMGLAGKVPRLACGLSLETIA